MRRVFVLSVREQNYDGTVKLLLGRLASRKKSICANVCDKTKHVVQSVYEEFQHRGIGHEILLLFGARKAAQFQCLYS